MRKLAVHQPFCFADQPADCTGYFRNDALPCVCGTEENLLSALSQTIIPAVPMIHAAPEIQPMPLSA